MNALEQIAADYQRVENNTQNAMAFVSEVYDLNTGDTRAHIMAQGGYVFGIPDVLRLTNLAGETVLDIMTQSGSIIDSDAFYLQVKDIAYAPISYAIELGYEFHDPELLKLTGHGGVSLAHRQAGQGYRFSEPELLRLIDDRGISVADIVYAEAHTAQTIQRQ